MKDERQCPEEPGECENQICGGWDLGGESFSMFMARNQDISFGAGSPITCDIEPPTSECRSSSSSFLVEPSEPCFMSGLFFFHGSDDSNVLESASPVFTMPSFAFFSPGPVTEQGSCTSDLSDNISSITPIHGGNLVSFL